MRLDLANRRNKEVLLGSGTVQGQLWGTQAQDYAAYLEQVTLPLQGAAPLLTIARERLPAADVREGDLEGRATVAPGRSAVLSQPAWAADKRIWTQVERTRWSDAIVCWSIDLTGTA